MLPPPFCFNRLNELLLLTSNHFTQPLHPVDTDYLLMSSSTNLPHIQKVSITKIQIGSQLVNLGKLLEIEERENDFVLVIYMLDLKHVFRFEKHTQLYIII